ncbi:hypothetical protein STSP_55360 [Streptomyces jeddahensis]|uniref:RNA polymerase sigma-70 region 2 domain-containing protein n=1 Tax=Streptomyces jeddahensis TaxID=1716141 RepID=A0A177HKH1_9ACTN|nr:hypothetical protein STSP_55360 [Streptomyces jeddahensis]
MRSTALLRLAVLLTGGDRYAAEDLLQTALMKAYGRWALIEQPEDHVDNGKPGPGASLGNGCRPETRTTLTPHRVSNTAPDKKRALFGYPRARPDVLERRSRSCTRNARLPLPRHRSF